MVVFCIRDYLSQLDTLYLISQTKKILVLSITVVRSKTQVKGGESSSQFQRFTIAKIEL